jgi:hypothetical protein
MSSSAAWIQKHTAIIVLLAISLAGGSIILYATQNGPWGYSDSVAYLVSARNLIEGVGLGYHYPNGEFRPLTFYPPLYSLLIAVGSIFVKDVVFSARGLGILLYTFTLFGIGLTLHRFSRFIVFTGIGLVLLAVYPPVLILFSSVMSEPLYLFTTIFAVYALLRYFETGRTTWFIASAILAGCVSLTRYIGLSALIAMPVCVFIFQQGTLKQRINKSLLYAAISGSLFLLWLAWTYFNPVNQSVAGRGFNLSWAVMYTNLKFFYDAYISTLWGSVPLPEKIARLPVAWKYITSALLFTSLYYFAFRSYRRNPVNDDGFRVSIIFGLLAAGYSLILLAATLFTSPAPVFNDRMFLPVFASLILACAATCSTILAHAQRKTQLISFAIIGLLFIVCAYNFTIQDISAIADLHRGDTNTGNRWREDQLMQALRDLPEDMPITSTNPDLVLLWADRPSYDLTEHLTPEFLAATTVYGSDPSDPSQSAFQQGGLLVVFNNYQAVIKGKYGSAGKERLQTLFDGLTIVNTFDKGIIYTFPQ